MGPLALCGGPHQKLGLSYMLRMTHFASPDSCSASSSRALRALRVIIFHTLPGWPLRRPACGAPCTCAKPRRLCGGPHKNLGLSSMFCMTHWVQTQTPLFFFSHHHDGERNINLLPQLPVKVAGTMNVQHLSTSHASCEC